MKSAQHQKSISLHSQESRISHKPKIKRKFYSALRRFSKSINGNSSSSKSSKSTKSAKSTSDFSEKFEPTKIDFSQLKYRQPVHQQSSFNLKCLPLWSDLILRPKPADTKTSSLENEYSMDPSEDSKKNTKVPSDLPSVSPSESPEIFENPNFCSTLNDNSAIISSFENFNSSLDDFNVHATSYIPETSNTLNIPLQVALKELLNLVIYLQESDTHIKHVLSKYIQNENLEQELLKVLSGHSEIHNETEKQCFKLANELFSVETENFKGREKTLQDSLDVAAYFNRIMEEEIQNLKGKNEKLIVDYQNEHLEFIIKNSDDLYKNNNELRAKYRNLIIEIKKLDNELRSLQNQNRMLTEQIADANGQIRNYRDMLHREMGEHELEHVALGHQLQINEQIIKDCNEAGDLLNEDLTQIKKQLKSSGFDINWTTYKNRGNTIVDLLHLSRTYLNELTRELIKSNPKNTVNHLSENNLQSYESKIHLQQQKIHIMKSEIDLGKKEKEIITESLKNEKLKTLTQEKTIEEMKNQIVAKDMIIKKMATQEKPIENDEDKNSLLKYQQTFFMHLQQQQKDIEELNRQNNELKTQLTNERAKLIGKSEELAKQINATNLMHNVQSQMNLEYSKNLSLEANALSANFELNRLSVVAEYNNEISKQLKEMIAAKDKTISALKTSLDKLNINEKKNLQEKAALCNEITEASYIIKQLRKELENEKLGRKTILCETERYEKNADCKIQELHQMIIEERQALRALLKEYQSVVNQKQNVETSQQEQLHIIENYAKNEEKMKSSLKGVHLKCNEIELKCNKLNQKIDELYGIIDEKENKVRNCANDYENKLSARDGIIEKQKCKNEELQNTIQYLQCNIQKFQSDLNELRSNEKTKTDQIKQCSAIIDKFKTDVEEQKNLFDKVYTEKQQLEGRLTEAVLQYNSLYEDYNKLYEETQQMEEQYKIEIEQLNTSKTKSFELLENCSKENIAQMEAKQLEINKIKIEMEQLDQIRSEFSEKTRILEEALNNQQKFDENLIKEKNRCIKKVKDLSNTVNLLKNELESCLKQRDEDISNFKKFTADLKSDSETHKKIMLDDLNKLSSELLDLNEKCTIKSVKLHDLRLQYKEMTENMRKVINLLIKERFEHKMVEAQNKLLNKELDEIKSKFQVSNSISPFGDCNKTDLENAKKYLDEATNNIEYLEKEVHVTTEKLRKLEQITIMQENYMVSQLQNRSDLLKSVNKEHEILLERYNKLKNHTKMTNQIIIALRTEIAHLNQTIQILEFQKCDLTLKYHELNAKFQNEQSLNRTLKQSHQHLLAAAYEISSVSSVQSICNNLD